MYKDPATSSLFGDIAAPSLPNVNEIVLLAPATGNDISNVLRLHTADGGDKFSAAVAPKLPGSSDSTLSPAIAFDWALSLNRDPVATSLVHTPNSFPFVENHAGTSKSSEKERRAPLGGRISHHVLL